jgi:uncharacterized protein YbbK (DUF523 family)
LDKATLQCDDVLGHLKAMDGHASRNVSEICHNMRDGVPIPRPTTLIFSSHEVEGFASIPNASLDSRLLVGDGGEWMMTKAEMLQSQF